MSPVLPTPSFTEVLVNALVTSRIDYSNGILAGIPNKLIHRLQVIQNSAAWIITHAKSTEHVTTLLIQLHWFSPSKRINFKLLLLTFEELHNLAHRPPPSCAMQPSSTGLLVLPAVNLITVGARAFSYAAHKLWNSLAPHSQAAMVSVVQQKIIAACTLGELSLVRIPKKI